MATYNTINTDFTGGLMSPHLRGRLDIDKFNKGLQRMENFLPSIQGPVSFRQGTEWIREEAEGSVRLIEFTINNRSRFLLALSAGLFRIYATDGSLLYTRGGGVDGSGVPVSADDGFGTMVTVPYLDDQIMDVRYSREVETMIFTHPMHPPYELTANTVYDVLQLTAASEYVTTLGDADNINGTFLNTGAAVVNGKPKWVLYDDPVAQTTEYWYGQYNGTDWEVVVAPTHPTLTDGHVYYTNTSDSDDFPTSGWDAGADDTGTTIPTFTEGLSELQDSASTPLYAGAVGSEGLRPWAFEPVAFTSHPFQKIDTSDTTLKISDEVERVRLISSEADWVEADVDKYTEYKVGNQWSLGKIVEFIGTKEVIVDPVESVVNIEDPSVRLAMFDNRSVEDPLVEARGWLERDGVDAGKTHVRADTLIFRTSHIGSWVRIGGDRLLTNVCDPTDSAAFNSQDGKVRWGKILDYRGVEDHPVDFVEGTYAAEKFDSGSVYEVYEWGASILGLISFDGTGTDTNTDLASAVRKTGGTNRFAMNHDLYTYTGLADDTTSWTGEAKGGDSSEAITANMSNQIQFDVVEVSNGNDTPDHPEPLLVSGDNLISPGGNVTAYDLVTDPRKLDGEAGTYATHTATLTASRLFFDESRDVGRYVLGNLVDKWVLMKINGTSLLPYSAQVDVLTSIPRDELTDDLKNNGVFTQFRWGAWYEDNYPATVSFYEQRRVFAGTRDHPNLVWLSSLNDSTDFRTVENDGQVIDTTGITYQLGTGSTIIRWLETGPTLIVGTESNEWQLRPNEFSAAITPSNIRITQETSIGSRIQGSRIGGSVFFPHISGKQLHEFKFDFQTQQFVIETVTKLVPDLFEDDPILSLSYQFNPNSTIWIVTEGGNLFSLTYRKEDDYYAWAKHSTPGSFKDVVVVPKGDTASSEDQVWFIIERSGVHNMERMANSFTDSGADNYRARAAFLDSYLRNPKIGSLESPTTEISIPARCIVDGLARIVVDGVDLGLVAVTEGVNTLPDSLTASQYTLVGLPYTGVLQMNPQAFDSPGKNAYGQIKRVVSMRPYLYKSLGYKVGFHMDNLEEIDPCSDGALFTGFTEEHTILDSNFDVDETPLIVQDKAYPLTLVSNVIKTDLH